MNEFEQRKKYTGRKRGPFFEIARPYITGLVVDIGAGDGEFFKTLDITRRPETIALESNSLTVKKLQNEGIDARLYTAPERLPFGDKSVSVLHSSHLIEHLSPEDLYTLLQEIDRVLATDGILIVSAPLLWEKFYDDLSHIKPYPPKIFINYLVSGGTQRTRQKISTAYSLENLVFRYGVAERSLFSTYRIIDFLLQKSFVLGNKLGFRRYYKNGYTIVLRKNT